jgi:hypothetical protein
MRCESEYFIPIRQYREKLLRLYQKQNMTEEYREQLRILAANHGYLECYRELKALYPAEEWDTVREMIFAQAILPVRFLCRGQPV